MREDISTGNTDAVWAFDQYEAIRNALPDATFPEMPLEITSIDIVAEQFDAVLLDAFGVLNVGDTPIPGAIDFIAALRRKDRHVRIVSNSASVPTEVSHRKFERFGFDFMPEEVITSRDALKIGLGVAPERTWGVMATGSSEIEELGVACTMLEDDISVYDQVDAFILLGSGEWTAHRQDLLARALIDRPRLVFVGNPDIVAPREDGLSREPGFFAHDLQRRTDCRIEFFGKPFANIFDLAMRGLPGVACARTVMVGDTLHTDVLGGAAAGMKTLLIREYGLFAGMRVDPFVRHSGIIPDLSLQRYHHAAG